MFINYLSFFHSVFQWDRERERLRESQREKPWGRAGLPEGATGNEHRCTGAEAEPISDDDLRSVAFCKNFISYSHFFISVREKERNILREGRRESTEHRAPEQRQRRRVISDLRSAIADLQWGASDDELRRRGDVTVGFWVWFAGAWFWFVYWEFFF